MAGPSPSPHRNAQWRSNKSPLLYSWTFHWEHVTVLKLQTSLQGDPSPATASSHQQAVLHTVLGVAKPSINFKNRLFSSFAWLGNQLFWSTPLTKHYLVLGQSEYLQLWREFFERWLLFKINASKEKEILTTENEEVKTLQSTQGFEIQATSLISARRSIS